MPMPSQMPVSVITQRLNSSPRAIPSVSSNDLRRTYNQWAKQAGVDNDLLAPMMGHSTTRMVEETYGKLPIDKLLRRIDLALKAH